MEQLADVVPMVQILDSPVPQMVEQLLEVFRLLDTQMPVEQAIAVPKISLDPIPQRSVDLAPQMVEQLVEVPTFLTLSSLQQTAEQIVDIPVPGGHDRRRLQGFLSRQSSTAAGVVQNVDIPVRGGLRVFLPGQDSQHTVEQLVDSSSGGLQDFLLGQGSSASSSGREDEAFPGVFRTFPRIKKSAASAASPSPIVPPSVSSWTRAAYEDLDSADEPATQQDEDEELLFEEEEDPTGWIESQSALGRPFYWHRCSRRSLWYLPPGASSRRRKGRTKRKKKAPKSSSLRSTRGMRTRRCWQGLCSRSLLSGARPWSFPCSSFAWLVYWLLCCSRSVPFVVGRPEMLRIMAGADQRDSYAVGWFYWYCTSCCVPLRCRQAQDAPHHGRYGPEGQLCGWFCRHCTSGRAPPCRLQAQDACHHGRYGPEGPLYGELPFSFSTVACARLVLLFVHTSRCVLCVLGRPRCSASWPV